ncbi:hypothetical protein GCM10025331_32760 [Actinoplanes utahensis]|nr:hypothetical protein Aut01nite_48630 [Actinoplanes utahensis]
MQWPGCRHTVEGMRDDGRGVIRHRAEESQRDVPFVRSPGGAGRQVAAQMVAGLFRREEGDEQAAQEDSRAAGPPPNRTSSQLGRRLRGLLVSSASLLADCGA